MGPAAVALVCAFRREQRGAVLQFLLLTVVFCIVAAGNDLCGLLNRPVSRKLGEMAYSVYLLHGLLLYATFNFVLGAARSRDIVPAAAQGALYLVSV